MPNPSSLTHNSSISSPIKGSELFHLPTASSKIFLPLPAPSILPVLTGCIRQIPAVVPLPDSLWSFEARVLHQLTRFYKASFSCKRWVRASLSSCIFLAGTGGLGLFREELGGCGFWRGGSVLASVDLNSSSAPEPASCSLAQRSSKSCELFRRTFWEACLRPGLA